MSVWLIWSGSAKSHKIKFTDEELTHFFCGKKIESYKTTVDTERLCDQCSGRYATYDLIDVNDDNVPPDQL